MALALPLAAVALFGLRIWTQSFQSPTKKFNAIVTNKMSNGTTLADVRQWLGPSPSISSDLAPSYVALLASRQDRPDGLQPTDKFLYYSVPGEHGETWELHFQFRNGKLINFKPEWYRAETDGQTMLGLSN